MLPSFSKNERPFYDRLFFRAIVVGLLTLIMLIPLEFVSEMVRDRSYLQKEVVRGISNEWGLSQTLNGPCLAVPYSTITHYTETYKDENGKLVTVPRQLIENFTKIVLPYQLDFDATLNPLELHRGIYKYVVYSAPVTITGTFRLPAKDDFDSKLHEIHWDKAWLSLGITDLKAIKKVETLVWNEKEGRAFSPGTNLGNLLGPGFHTIVDLPPDSTGKEAVFSLNITLNGSGGLHFTPVGERTTINVRGDWPHPSFSGSLLPTDRTVTTDNFKGFWDIPHLARTYPQMGDYGQEYQATGDAITSFKAGVDLFEAVSLYTQVNRATKYGIMFIGLTYIALLAFELFSQRRLHLFQYGLVGVAMSLFYLVLLSVSEHYSFPAAFVAASAVSVAMNGLYIAASMRSKKMGAAITVLLVALYALLYALLRMEDYALLMGTALMIIVVCVLMFLTRNLRTDGTAQPASPAQPGQAAK